MYNYIIGTVTEVNANNISLDNNGVGYLVYTPNPYMFELGKEYKVYIYEQVREDEHSLYGFKDMETKELFLKLIDVKGLGPKMTMPMLATGSVEGIKDAIERENLLYLKICIHTETLLKISIQEQILLKFITRRKWQSFLK